MMYQYVLFLITVTYINSVNSCIEVKFIEEARNCSTIKYFHPPARYVNRKSFQNLKNVKIEYLDLSQLNITDVSSVFPKLPIIQSLRILRLDCNIIETISSTAFASMTQLYELYLEKNAIKSLDEEAFKELNSLNVLHLGQNQIKRIDFVKHLLSVKKLILMRNYITNVDIFSTSKLIQLEYLDLSDNQITCINVGFFNNLPEIEAVHLQNNRIHIFAAPVVVKRGIDLSNNELTRIESDNIQQGALIYLGQNKLCCEFIRTLNRSLNVVIGNISEHNCSQECEHNVIVSANISYIIIAVVIFTIIIFCIIIALIVRKCNEAPENRIYDLVLVPMEPVDEQGYLVPTEPIYEVIEN